MFLQKLIFLEVNAQYIIFNNMLYDTFYRLSNLLEIGISLVDNFRKQIYLNQSFYIKQYTWMHFILIILIVTL